MMRKVMAVMVAVGVMLALAAALFPAPVMAAEWKDPVCGTLDKDKDEDAWIAAGCGGSRDDNSLFAKIPGAVMAVFSVAGVVAVGVIIFAGVRYTISQGDPGKVKKAKDTIMYALIGLIVVLFAFAITAFILGGIQ